ncbi:MAG: ABC transporter permease [Anaerolineales bacterium]|nr:ABC transporter permease [Anaerolineales bacterium]
MAAAVLVFLWILDELSFDSFHDNYDDIYRIVTTMHNDGGDLHIATTAAPLAPKFEESFPEILETARFRPAISEMLVTHREKKYYEKEIAFADKEFFRIFTHPFIHGSDQDPFPTKNSAVISKQIAQKYFGDENPVGQSISLDDKTIITISGVIENVPANSHLQFNILLHFDLFEELLGLELGWENLSYYAYALLRENVNHPALKAQIDTLTNELYSHGTYEFLLQPLSDVHLRSSFDVDVYGHTEPTDHYIRIFILIGIFILSISVINYINLSTARSTTRAREVGVRKVFGARRGQLIRQFMGESFFLCLLSYLIAMLLVEAALPSFNAFTGKEVNIDYSDLHFLFGVMAILVFTGILSGSYPALFLSSYIPARTLKGDIKSGSLSFRRVLVILQFSIAILMIICTGIVYRQLAFIQNRNLGINTDQVIYFPVMGNIGEKLQLLKEELHKYPGVKGVTNSESLPTSNLSGTYGISWEGKKEEDNLHINVNKVDHDYIPTFGIELAEGRNFSLDHPADSSNFILNEAAIRLMNIKDPIGKRFSLWGMNGTIIGVMKDYNFNSLHKVIDPLCLYITNPDYAKVYGYICIKLEGSDIRKSIRTVEGSWNKLYPVFPMDYNFLEEEYAGLYLAESRMRSLFALFAALSVFLSCLGLYGLSSFMAERRTREIGIRKAMGASSWQIFSLFSWDALKWILISNLIAWPIAWLYMKQWLNDFAYKASISPWIFLLSGFIVLLISVITLSFQAQKAARINPATTIKQE